MSSEQTKEPNPHHQPNTFSTADVQRFESQALPPDAPEGLARLRKGRPIDHGRSNEESENRE